MKHKIFLPLFVLLVACSSEDNLQQMEAIEESSSMTEIRSIETAIRIADKAISQNKGESRAILSANPCDVKVITSNKSRSENADTLIYAINYGKDNGFVLVSAPCSVEPIIAITDEGEFGDAETEANESFQYALQAAKDYVSQTAADSGGGGFIPNGPDTPEPLIKYFYSDTITYNVLIPKKLEVEWGQTWPENIYCSNGYAGCAIVAVAQICSYFELPKSLTLTYDGHDKDILQLDWTEIKKHKKSTFCVSDGTSVVCSSCNDSGERHYDLARFIRQIGESTGAKYDEDGTKANFSNMINWLKENIPNKLYAQNSGCNVSTWLSHNGIALMRGDMLSSSGELVGHEWVADGYQETGYTINNYVYDGNGYVLESQESTKKEYFHYNWGFRGNCNGFFLKDIFKLSEGESYDNPSLSSSSEFKYNVKYFAIYQSDNE